MFYFHFTIEWVFFLHFRPEKSVPQNTNKNTKEEKKEREHTSNGPKRIGRAQCPAKSKKRQMCENGIEIENTPLDERIHLVTEIFECDFFADLVRLCPVAW